MSYNINMTTTGDPAISRLAAVSVKIPDFLPQHPSLWIRQAEAQFVLANVSQDSTKYYHLYFLRFLLFGPDPTDFDLIKIQFQYNRLVSDSSFVTLLLNNFLLFSKQLMKN